EQQLIDRANDGKCPKCNTSQNTEHIFSHCKTDEIERNTKQNIIKLINESFKIDINTIPWWYSDDIDNKTYPDFQRKWGDRGLIPTELTKYIKTNLIPINLTPKEKQKQLKIILN